MPTPVHIFRGQARVFGFTEDRTGTNLPAQYGPWTAFKTAEVDRNEAQPGVDVAECLDDIARYGFRLTDAQRRITEQAAG